MLSRDTTLDYSIVSLDIDWINLTQWPGYFKLNNIRLLNEDYQEKIRIA